MHASMRDERAKMMEVSTLHLFMDDILGFPEGEKEGVSSCLNGGGGGGG